MCVLCTAPRNTRSRYVTEDDEQEHHDTGLEQEAKEPFVTLF